MDCFLHRLRALFRYKSRKSESDLDSNAISQCLASSQTTAEAVKLTWDVGNANTQLIQFLHNHGRHCINNNKHRFNTSQSTVLFKNFPLLPPELRIQIWKSVASQPHTVELSCAPSTLSGQWFSHSKPPSLFHVNSEARAVALKEFTVLKLSSHYIDVLPQPIYINFSSTSLWLCSDLRGGWARRLLERDEQLQQELRYLIINENLWKSLSPGKVESFWGLPIVTGKWQTSGRVSDGLKALEDVRFHS